MRKIINSTYISLDGVVENPHQWHSSGEDGGEGEAIQTELLLRCDAVVMGRRTYEGFAPVWPTTVCWTSCGCGCTPCSWVALSLRICSTGTGPRPRSTSPTAGC
jgi:dihydrofolate reductase